MVFLEIPKVLAISSIVTLLKPKLKNKSVDLCIIFFLIISTAKIEQETLKTIKVSKVYILYYTSLRLSAVFLTKFTTNGSF